MENSRGTNMQGKHQKLNYLFYRMKSFFIGYYRKTDFVTFAESFMGKQDRVPESYILGWLEPYLKNHTQWVVIDESLSDFLTVNFGFSSR